MCTHLPKHLRFSVKQVEISAVNREKVSNRIENSTHAPKREYKPRPPGKALSLFGVVGCVELPRGAVGV